MGSTNLFSLPMNNMTFYYCFSIFSSFHNPWPEGFLTVQTKAKILTTFTFTSQTMFTFHNLSSLSLSTTLRSFEGGLFAVQSVAMSLGSLAYPLVSTIYMGTLNSYPAAIYNVMQAETWQKDIVDKAPRLNISIVIWILSSDTFCQLN